jgi:membrane fusion protein (multidrug efflux system)
VSTRLRWLSKTSGRPAGLVPPLGLLTLTALLTVAACGQSSNANQKPPEPAPALVEAAPVTRQTIERELSVTGSLLPAAETTVSAEVSGRATHLAFDVQQAVRQGDILAHLDDTEYRLQLAQAKATLAQARLTAERAEQDFSRDTELLATGSIAQRAFDISRTARDAASAQLAAAEAALTLAEKRLADTAIRAPISGVITARLIDVGDYIRSPEAVATIMQVNPLKIRLSVPERFAASVQPGQPLTVSVEAYPGQTFQGKLTRINPATDPATRTFTAEGVLPNPDGQLKPGFFAKATVITGVVEQTLVVPAEAILTVDRKPVVFIARHGAATLTPVEVGDRQNQTVEILQGVAEQDSVLVNGHTTLTDGARISVVAR